MRKTKELRTNKGITLIALVITIIVMLILVAVTISMAVNGGLFEYAGNAGKETNNAIREEQQLASGQITVDNKVYNSIDEYLNKESNNTNNNGIKTEQELKTELAKQSGNSAIDQYGNIVDLALWNIETIDETTCKVAASEVEREDGYGYMETYEEAGYLGEIVNGGIQGNIPAFVKLNNNIYKLTELEYAFYHLGKVYNYDTKTYDYTKQLKVFPEIPFTVISIGKSAFSYCDGITSLAIPNNVISIGDSAFYNCDRID